MASNAMTARRKTSAVRRSDDRASTGEIPVITPEMLAARKAGAECAKRTVTARKAPATHKQVAAQAAKNAKAERKQALRDRKTSAKEKAVAAEEAARQEKKQKKAALRAEKREARRILRHKILIIVGSALVVLVAAGALIYPSAQQYYQTRRANDRLQAQADALAARNAQLESNVENLDTDQGIEDAARADGWVKNGENAVNVTDIGYVTSPTSIPRQIDLDAIQAPETWYTAVLDPFFGVD